MYVDIAAVLRNDAQPEPDVMPLGENGHLFYSGEFNLIHGDTESGKTWLCLAAVAEVLNRGGKAAVIDLDHNGAASIANRLLLFGVSAEGLTNQQHFRLAEPLHDVELKEVVTDLTTFEPDVVTIDSLGELLPLFRYNSNSADDFTIAHSTVIKPLALCGAAVLVVDHLAKGAESRASGPTGTAAKQRAVGGVSVRVTCEQAFKPGDGGSAKLELFKDRHGGVRKQFPKSEPRPVIGTFTITPGPDDDTLTYRIDSGLTVSMDRQKELNDKQASEDAQKIADLREGGADIELSVRSVRSVLKCGQPRAQRAIDGYKQLCGVSGKQPAA